LTRLPLTWRRRSEGLHAYVHRHAQRISGARRRADGLRLPRER